MERNTWESRNWETQKRTQLLLLLYDIRTHHPPSTILRRHLLPPPSSSLPSTTFPLLFLPCDNLFFKFDEFDLEWILWFIEENQLKLIHWGLLLLRSVSVVSWVMGWFRNFWIVTKIVKKGYNDVVEKLKICEIATIKNWASYENWVILLQLECWKSMKLLLCITINKCGDFEIKKEWVRPTHFNLLCIFLDARFQPLFRVYQIIKE